MRVFDLPWPAWALLSAAFAALTAVLGKVGVAQIDSNLATFLRTCVVLLFLAAMITAFGAWRPLTAVPGRSWLFLGLSGLATGASWLCYYRALKLGPAAGVATLDKLSVVLVAVFAVAFLGERLNGRNWLGVAMIAGGAVLVAWRR